MYCNIYLVLFQYQGLIFYRRQHGISENMYRFATECRYAAQGLELPAVNCGSAYWSKTVTRVQNVQILEIPVSTKRSSFMVPIWYI